MTGSRSYRDLVVWKKSMDLAESIYSCTRFFPSEEVYGMISQMRRAGASIPSNIAEGQARNSSGEFRQFPGIARGSVAELETWILLSERLGYLDSARSEKLLANCEEIHKLLTGLKKSLKPKEKTQNENSKHKASPAELKTKN
jgi:four helix bundle protein